MTHMNDSLRRYRRNSFAHARWLAETCEWWRTRALDWERLGRLGFAEECRAHAAEMSKSAFDLAREPELMHTHP